MTRHAKRKFQSNNYDVTATFTSSNCSDTFVTAHNISDCLTVSATVSGAISGNFSLSRGFLLDKSSPFFLSLFSKIINVAAIANMIKQLAPLDMNPFSTKQPCKFISDNTTSVQLIFETTAITEAACAAAKEDMLSLFLKAYSFAEQQETLNTLILTLASTMVSMLNDFSDQLTQITNKINLALFKDSISQIVPWAILCAAIGLVAAAACCTAGAHLYTSQAMFPKNRRRHAEKNPAEQRRIEYIV